MATSNTITFNETRDQLITNALSLIGVVAAGEAVQPNDITFCANSLNAMVKAWMSMGIHLWTEEDGTLFFVNGQAQYNLIAGATGAKSSDGSNTVETTLATAASTGNTTVSVTTATGMNSGDHIGIVLASNVIQWTTINGAPVGTVVTLTTPMSGPASSSAQVFTYTTQCPRVLSIQSCRVRDEGNFDRRIKIIPRQDYMMIPQKQLLGTPVILYYSPQLTEGTVYLWPTPQDVGQRLEFTYLRTIQDFDTGSDNPDFPQEWLECITYNLAVRVAPAYGINLSSGGINGNPDILRQAAQYLDDLKAWDTEQPYIQWVPGYRYNR